MCAFPECNPSGTVSPYQECNIYLHEGVGIVCDIAYVILIGVSLTSYPTTSVVAT